MSPFDMAAVLPDDKADQPDPATVEIIGPNDLGVYTPKSGGAPSPTDQQYRWLKAAYDHFNAALFEGRLPPCLITLQRQPRTEGYYAPRKFVALNGDTRTDEIALNPAYFREQGPEEILGTLVHEMVHLAQEHFGHPARRGYHDRAWAKAMKAIGLYPSDTGEPGGAETGYTISHYIVPDGPFARAYKDFEQTGTTIAWGDARRRDAGPATRPKRLKFICPGCGANVYGAPSVRVACVPCNREMQP